MRTSCVKIVLVLGIIFLFIGIAVQTAIAVNPNSIDMEEKYYKNTMERYNSDCSIIGHIKNAGFIPYFMKYREAEFYNTLTFIILYSSLYLLPFWITVDSDILIGAFITPTGGSHYIEANYGYVYTDGKYGKQEINGSLIGNLRKTGFIPPGQFEDGRSDYIGVEGFRGVITHSIFTGYTNLIGHAKRVGIEEYN